MNNTAKAEMLLKKKKTRGIRKKNDCIFTSDAKRGYDTDYEVTKIQIFISKFKEKRIKKKQNKRTTRQTKKLKLQLKNQSV